MNFEEFVASVVYRTRLEAVMRRTSRRPRVGVIVYHDPSPELLEQHLEFLAERYPFVTVTEMVDAIRTGDWSAFPDAAIAITLDDGHRGNLELATVLKRYGVRPTIYLATSAVCGDGRFWFMEPGIDVQKLKLVTPAERAAALRESAPQTGLADRHALQPEEVAALTQTADFGSHTVTHPVLPLCTDEEAADEITRSRRDVEKLTGTPGLHFCFPNGDYIERDVELVRSAGYVSARTTEIGWNGPRSDPFRLRIISGADDSSVAMLATHLSGLFRLRRLIPDRRRRRRVARARARLQPIGARPPENP
jgi:peptidoglycan/xylan/chitin deacetylase (PgdA/CDA1 family)